ncbi:superoxide dismutase [Mn], mitochondrial-like protein [Tanacetum coccineum]
MALQLNSGAMAFLVPNSILLTWHHFWSLAPKVWHHDSMCSNTNLVDNKHIGIDDVNNELEIDVNRGLTRHELFILFSPIVPCSLSSGWRAIDQHFGSMEKLISKMSVEGAATQGSGWVKNLAPISVKGEDANSKRANKKRFTAFTNIPLQATDALGTIKSEAGLAAEKFPCNLSLWYLNQALLLKNVADPSLSVILTSG